MKRLFLSLLVLCLLPVLSFAQTDDMRRPRSGLSIGANPSLSGGGFAYILRDDFTIAVAAGSVNGTAAVPGPGTRAVTDASSLLSLTSGLMVIANGNPAANTPVFGLNNIVTRTVGRIYISSRSQSNIGDICWSGWATAVGSRPDDGGFGFNGGVFSAREASAVQIGSTPTAGTAYKFAIINKANGNYYFIKGGTQFPYWQLVSIYGTASNANLYAVCRNAQVPIVGTISTDFIRVPNYLWTPKPISADSFGGTWPTTDGGGLTGIEAGGSGKTWGEFLSGSGTTGAGVTWDHEWNFSGVAAGGANLVDNPGTGKTALNLTAADTNTPTTDWANRTNEAVLFDGGDYFTAAQNADLNNIASDGNKFTVLAEVYIPAVTATTFGIVSLDTAGVAANSAWNIQYDVTLSAFYFVGSNGTTRNYIGGITVPKNSHYQVICTHDNGSSVLYVNGVVLSSGSTSTPQNYTGKNMAIGAFASDGNNKAVNGVKISRIATLKGTALTGDQVRAEYRKWVATSDAGVYARFYGGPQPTTLTDQVGSVAAGTWGSENAEEFGYQAYAIRFKPTSDSNPGNYDNSTSFLRRTGTWSIDTGTAVNAPVAGTEKVSDTVFDVAGDWTDAGANWSVAGGVATKVATAADKLTNSGGTAPVAGTYYRCGAAITRTAGTIQIGIGAKFGYSYNGNATAVNTMRATDTTKPQLFPDATYAGTVDNFTVKPLTLNQLITSINHTSTPDCYMSVKPTIATGFQAGIAFNIDDPNNPTNFNLVYYNQNDGKVYWDRCVNGTYTNQFNTTATYSAGAPLIVRKIGTSVYVWYNNAYVNSGTAVVTTGNYHGMFQTGSGATETKCDDWVAYGSGTNGEYGILNAFSN